MRILMTEKAVMMLERENVLTIETSSIKDRNEIKKEFEETLDVKIDSIRTLNRKNKKYAYIKLKGDTLAIDVVTKLGLM